MNSFYRNKFNRRGGARYEIRVKYVNGSYGVFGYCDQPDDEDAISAAEQEPGVEKARIFDPKTGKRCATREEIEQYDRY